MNEIHDKVKQAHQDAIKYYPPTPERIKAHADVRDAISACAAILDDAMPASREAEMAWECLQKALLLANHAIAIHWDTPATEQPPVYLQEFLGSPQDPKAVAKFKEDWIADQADKGRVVNIYHVNSGGDE